MEAGILTQAFVTVVQITRELDGRIWDYPSQLWLPPTEDSETAAHDAISGTVEAMLDLLPFPIEASIFGIVNINVNRGQMDTAMGKVQAAVRAYVNATRNF